MKGIPNKILKHIENLNTSDAFKDLTKIMGFSDKEASQILNIKIFDDVIFRSHSVVPNAIAGSISFDDGKWISIVGGGNGLYGDGNTTFEVLTSEIDNPLTYLKKDEVNQVIVSLQ
mgnify:FL=1